MDKNINISLAGIPFTMDAEAYRLLKEYLVKIEMGYKDNPDGKEIIEDIEARISELILNEQSAQTQVSEKLITGIIAQLGMPDDIDINANVGGNDPEHRSGIPRRLYRNSDGAKLGGVCSGLATYFNVEPVTVRLLFCAPLILLPIAGIFHFGSLAGFFGTMVGVSLLLYFILWFSIPKAKTPRQKLEMRGDRITASSIQQNIQDDFDEISQSPKSERNASALADFIYVLGKIVLFGLKAILALAGLGIALGVVAAIVAVVTVLVSGEWPYMQGFWETAGISGINITTFFVLALAVAVLPLIMVFYLILKLVFDIASGKTALSIIFGIWLIVLVYLTAMSVRNFDNIRDAVRHDRIERYFDEMEDRWDDDWWDDDRHEHERRHGFETLSPSGDTLRIDSVRYEGNLVTDTTKVEYFTITER